MEQIHGIAYSGYVGHCVQRPHLMEMNVSHRTSVRLCFRFGNGIIYGPGMTFCFLREFQSVDEPGNVPRRRMMMTAMMMVPVRGLPASGGRRLFLFFSVYGYLHMGSRNSAGRSGLRFQPHTGQPQMIHYIQESFFIIQQFIQSGHQHVSCRPHIALNI